MKRNAELSEMVLDACKEVFVEYFDNDESDEIVMSGLACLDALVEVIVGLIDTGPDKVSRDQYAAYASSLIVTQLRENARLRGEDDSLPDERDEARMEAASRIIKSVRQQEGIDEDDLSQTLH